MSEKLDVTEMHRRGRGAELDNAIEQAMAIGFRPASERILNEERGRAEATAKILPFGVKFLDDALGGLFQTDVVLLGAESGAGKTELSRFIAMYNAVRGRRVHFLALEADQDEIERRMKYQLVADMVFAQHRDYATRDRMNYMDWYLGRLKDVTERYDRAVDKLIAEKFKTLQTLYRIKDFDVVQLERRFMEIAEETDLIVLDHLHYLDSNDQNENRAVKTIVKCIRDIALTIKKPIIVVAHLRKDDQRFPKLVPALNDFEGTGHIGKIATKAILLSPAKSMPSGNRQMWNTFISPAKCRVDGSRARYVALVPFNAAKNSYEDSYVLGRMEKMRTEFKSLEPHEMPEWAKGATKPDAANPPHYTDR